MDGLTTPGDGNETELPQALYDEFVTVYEDVIDAIQKATSVAFSE